MKLARFLFAFSGAAAVLPASERAVVSVTCPLDRTTFQAVRDVSGSSHGMRLDMKKLGTITQPWALPQCPTCRFPVYDAHPAEADRERLWEIVQSPRFLEQTRGTGPWFSLGVLREELAADPYLVAWTFLNASWEDEDEPEAYARDARRAIVWFDRAAARLGPDRTRERYLSLYLPIELHRRLGEFSEAQRRLKAMPAITREDVGWVTSALATQQRLIDDGTAAPEERRTLARP